MQEASLKSGNRFTFTNPDNSLEAEVYFEESTRNSWANGFKIFFNGAIIHSSKTFKPLQKKLTEICNRYELTEAE